MVWNFGTFLCKFIGAITYVNLYASVLLLTALSIDRWVAVARATRPNSCRKLNLAQGICSVIWLLSFLLSLPSFLYRGIRPYTRFNDTILVNNVSNGGLGSLNKSIEAPMKCEFYIPKETKNRIIVIRA